MEILPIFLYFAFSNNIAHNLLYFKFYTQNKYYTGSNTLVRSKDHIIMLKTFLKQTISIYKIKEKEKW